jgi:murein L,D-transpeptidase YcbB/YkuD
LQTELVKYQDLIVKPTRHSVLLKHLSAWRNPDVSVGYFPDLHNRDGKVLVALNALYSLSRD